MYSIDGSPGITKEALSTLEILAKKQNAPLLVALMKDEIYI